MPRLPIPSVRLIVTCDESIISLIPPPKKLGSEIPGILGTCACGSFAVLGIQSMPGYGMAHAEGRGRGKPTINNSRAGRSARLPPPGNSQIGGLWVDGIFVHRAILLLPNRSDMLCLRPCEEGRESEDRESEETACGIHGDVRMIFDFRLIRVALLRDAFSHGCVARTRIRRSWEFHSFFRSFFPA